MLAQVVGGIFLIDLHATRETTFLANLTIAVEIVIASIALLVCRDCAQ